ncbi:MAG TPA: glycosyltransferase family 4 protein [Terriglobales bacterium]|nr:glycosyltransferase family 4 protein [Terriglobales bacterium]
MARDSRSMASGNGSGRSRRIQLVTSGLGTGYGGIGVVSASVMAGLAWDNDVALWTNRTSWVRAVRRALLLSEALLGCWRNPPDFVFYEHVHLAAMHAVLPRLRSIPYGVFLHGTEVWEPLSGRRREALERATILISNSASTVRRSREFNPWLGPVRITWLGVRVPAAAPDVRSKAPVAIIVGRLVPGERGKGHDSVLGAWPLVRRGVPDARLVIIGNGADLPRLERRVRREEIPGVEFRPRLTDLERNHAYESARVFLFPSRQEGFGLAPVEAAGWGIPLLGLAGTVMEELFPAGEGAVLVDNLEPAALAAPIIKLLRDGEAAAALGQAARQRVRSVFQEDQFIERLRAALLPVLP